MPLDTSSLDYREDLAGVKWKILTEVRLDTGNVRYQLRSEPGSEEAVVKAPDLYKMDSVEFWDAVDTRDPLPKLEGLVDSEAPAAIEEVFFGKGTSHRKRYQDVLNTPSTHGWTLLFRAVLFERQNATIEALAVAGADIAAEQAGYFPPAGWSPVAVALAQGDEGRVRALLQNNQTPPKTVFAAVAAAAILDVERGSDRPQLVSVIIDSPAYASAKESSGGGFFQDPPISDDQIWDFLSASKVNRSSGWLPLLRTLLRGDFEGFAQQAQAGQPRDLERCERVVRKLGKALPSPNWNKLATSVQTARRTQGGDDERSGGRRDSILKR